MSRFTCMNSGLLNFGRTHVLSRSARNAPANEHWRPLCHTCTFSASQRIPDCALAPVRASLSPHLGVPQTLFTLVVCTAEFVHCKGSLDFRQFLIVNNEQREECFHTFRRWHSAEEFSCRRNIRFLHGDQSRPEAPMSVSNPPRNTALANSASMSSRRTGSQAPMPRHHWTSTCRACLTLSVSITPPRTSSTKASSAKQSSCGDGPAENAATS